MTDNFKKLLAMCFAVMLLIAIIIYGLNVARNSNYLNNNTNNNNQVNTGENKDNINIENNTEAKPGIVEEGTAFTSRSVSGGGDTPGWLISVNETQPNVFTGKLLANEGVNTYELFVQEQDGFFTGDAKNKNEVKKFSFQKTIEACKDKDGNTFEYSLKASFDGKVLNGCGGSAVAKK